VPTAAVVLDLDARIVDANPAAERATGLPRTVLVGRSVGAVTTPHDAAAHRPHWRELVAGRRERYDLPGVLLHADGTLLPIRITVSLIRDGAGRPAGGVAFAHPPDDRPGVPPARRPSDAEAAVLSRLAAGRSIQQIADDLRLTRRGVDYRIAQLRRKLRAEGPDGAPATSAALVARAYTLGILTASVWPPRVDLGTVRGH
jgi:PAS domain S-box-containing protein